MTPTRYADAQRAVAAFFRLVDWPSCCAPSAVEVPALAGMDRGMQVAIVEQVLRARGLPPRGIP